MNTELSSGNTASIASIPAKRALFYKPILKRAWEQAKKGGTRKRIGYVIGVAILLSLALDIFVSLVSGVPIFAEPKQQTSLYKALSQITGFVSGLYLSYVAAKVALSCVREDGARMWDILLLKTGAPGEIQNFVITRIMYILRTALGFLLLLVPGIVWSYRFRFAELYAITENISWRAAFKKSSDLVYGAKWQLAGLDAILLGLTILAILPVLIGLIWLIPLAFMLQVVVFFGLQQVESVHSTEQNTVQGVNESAILE